MGVFSAGTVCCHFNNINKNKNKDQNKNPQLQQEQEQPPTIKSSTASEQRLASPPGLSTGRGSKKFCSPDILLKN